MTIIEILDSVQYVVDNQGKQTAVQFDLPTWQALREFIEDRTDIADIQQARQEDDPVFDWAQVVAEHKAQYKVADNVQN